MLGYNKTLSGYELNNNEVEGCKKSSPVPRGTSPQVPHWQPIKWKFNSASYKSIM